MPNRRMFILILLSTCLLYNTVYAQASDCAALWDNIPTIIETHIADLDVEGTYTPPHDVIWVDVYEAVSDSMVTYLTTCQTDESASDDESDSLDHLPLELDFGWEHAISRYRVRLNISLLDVNLDEHDEVLLSMHVGTLQYGSSRAFATVFYQFDASWEQESLWPPPLTALPEDLPHAERRLTYNTMLTTIAVHDQPDILGRTYMGIHFLPGLGDDIYINGLIVIRWDDLEAETVLFLPEGCFGSEWEVNVDGLLAIPTGSSIPWQGCTVPQSPGIPIPDAYMVEG